MANPEERRPPSAPRICNILEARKPNHEPEACSNDLVSAFTGKGAAERPAGSAAVKEFWDGGKVIGRAAYVKTADKSNGGDPWFWYVEVDGQGVLANGLASQDMVAKSACVGCHGPAGSDADHTTSAHSGDFVYTQVER